MTDRVRADFVVRGASELATCAGPAPARGAEQGRVAVLPRGAVAAREGKIVWVGPEDALAASVELVPGARRLDVEGRAVLPGLVDAHTHLVWGGDRADEFEKRLAGATYSEIAAAGGGILGTVKKTRAASLDELTASAGARMDRMARWGVTSFEVKSGYGLCAEAEYKMLEAARRAAATRPYALATTFLGAHTMPPEARGDAAARARYVDALCDEMIPHVAEAGLARFVDVFVDANAFGVEEARRVLDAGRRAGLGLKVHADQLASDGGAELAGEMGAVSAEHLEHASEAGLKALAAAGTVAVLLPAATLFLRMKEAAPARRMIELGVPVALSTDVNPGSCPCESLPVTMQLGCLLCGLTVDEAIVAATLNGAAAAGLAEVAGSVEVGKRCDLLVLDAAERRQLLYQFGAPRLFATVAAGHVLTA